MRRRWHPLRRLRRLRPRLPRLRLRHKLGISLSIGALLPVLVASSVAVGVVLRGLDARLQEETDRQRDVGVNLVLRHVERIGQTSVRLSNQAELSRAMRRGKDELAAFLEAEGRYMPSALIQVADETGAIIGREVAGGVDARFDGIGVKHDSAAIRAGLSYERRITLVTVDGAVVVRAAAPIVDSSYYLKGVIVVSLPLDDSFADRIKAALGTDVLIFGDPQAAYDRAGGFPPELPPRGKSTFLDRRGARVGDIVLDSDIAAELARGQTAFSKKSILGREYAVGYAPLQTLAGEVIGVLAVAVDRAPLLEARAAATRSLALGAAGAFVFALGLAGLLSRRLTRPIARLHSGARAIAEGDLDHRIEVDEGDEIGDLAEAFSHMTNTLKDNQERLAARMREIVALHDAGRAVSSEIDLDQVLRKIVDQVARVLGVRLCALWLVDGPEDDEPTLQLGAARAKRADIDMAGRRDESAQMAQPMAAIAAEVARTRRRIRADRTDDDPARFRAAAEAGVTGSLVALPLVGKRHVVGVLIIGRDREGAPFSAADADLLSAFGDQAAAAIENARLYEAVRAFNEELEQKVNLRTTELTAMNRELGRALNELRETQSQLILSERLAGLGQLVAGVAHEINSPSAAIRGAADAMGQNAERLADRASALSGLGLTTEEARRFIERAARAAEVTARRRLASAKALRRASKALCARLERAGVSADLAFSLAAELADLGLAPAADEDDAAASAVAALFELLGGSEAEGRDERARILAGYLAEYIHLQRAAATIQNAIRRIQRIVGALKSYSHLDQEAAVSEADIHEGIENTLVILDHQMARGITVTRRYGEIPRIPVYVDELNQVWTNLLHNAVQALRGKGNIEIETESTEDGVIVGIIDDGPGIPEDAMPRIFESFFTTKAKGEGTGLGLGIVRQIVEKHGGRVRATSRPGATRFEVWLPRDGPQAMCREPGSAPS